LLRVGWKLGRGMVEPDGDYHRASGAIFGIAGALISVLYLGKASRVQACDYKAHLRVCCFLPASICSYGAAISRGISNSAHIGGVVTGLALGAVAGDEFDCSAGKRQLWSLVVFAGAGVVLLGGFIFIRHSLLACCRWRKGYIFSTADRVVRQPTIFEAVVSRDPKNARALVLLGNAYLQKEQYEKATETFTRALQIDPYDSDSQFCLGWSQLKLGKNQQAVDSLEKAVLLNPHDAEAEDALGQAYQAVGNKTAAQVAFHRAVELKKSPSHKI